MVSSCDKLLLEIPDVDMDRLPSTAPPWQPFAGGLHVCISAAGGEFLSPRPKYFPLRLRPPDEPTLPACAAGSEARNSRRPGALLKPDQPCIQGAGFAYMMEGMQPPQERYSRQILFPGIGPQGQRKLAGSRIVIVGCGATGSVLSSLLVRAGVGYVRIIDRDYIEPSNLQRQVLFDERDAADSLPKAIAASRKLQQINSEVIVEPHVEDLTPSNCAELLEGTDLILDGTDNFETRYLLNDYAVRERRGWIYTAAVGSYGVTMNIVPGETACLACVFPQPPEGATQTCDTGGILNSAVNLIASLAVTEAMKFLVGARAAMRTTLFAFDAWYNDRSEICASHPRPDCSVCQLQRFPYLAGRAHPHISLCGRNSVQIHERHRPIDFAELEARLAPHGEVRHTQYVLKFLRSPYELTLFPDGRAIIKGTTDTGVARSFYARFIGS